MYFSKCSVRVLGGDEREGGYVVMQHGQQYKLVLRNDKDVPCDAEVVIGGKNVGKWRVGARSAITLERPVNDHGCFTFYEAGTPEGDAAGIVKGDSHNGLISVTFRPGQVKSRPLVSVTNSRWRWINGWMHRDLYDPWDRYVHYDPCVYPGTVHYSYNSVVGYSGDGGRTWNCVAENKEVSGPSYKEGCTGLSGHSSQEFSYVEELDYEYGQEVTIHLRLVSNEKREAIKPLKATATAIPAAV